ncbi:MAG: peroxisomal biogenesis factor 11-domain-containing protein [Benjaminiella poitrasii]|nr:MAG: peroxisomal biogenesis factor 11-domain-containing protein [Benjaminiella poitrasii]
MSPNVHQQNIPSYVLPAPSPPPELESPYENTKPINMTTTGNRWLSVIQRFLKELDGRDKLMKIIQYFVKILLHYKLVRAKHWPILTSHFSMTRKVIRLGTSMGLMREISPFKHSVFETMVHLNAVVNGISDDVFCFYKLGLVGPYLGNRSEILSAYCWFAGILADIRENAISMNNLQQKAAQLTLTKDDKKLDLKLNELKQKIFMTEVSIIKLLMDAVFCACDIWRPTYSSSLQAWSGFFSGLLAGYKLCIKYSA